jgi:glycosyltransferase 2 family protein
VCFVAVGHSPPFGVLVLGYLIGQLGGNIPVPGGIGGLDAGLVGVFVLYHQPLAASTAAVLLYHGIALWVPGLLGSLAFIRLRRTLQRQEQPAIICMPLAEPIETGVPMAAGTGA